MSLNDTPSGERVHIGFFGRRNAGKSSLVNAVTGQELSVVSDVKGTTTDPVYKAMELLPLGPVEIIDTPGFDDEGALGELRVKKTRQILAKTDMAVLAADGTVPLGEADRQLIGLFKENQIPFLIVFTKADLSVPQITGENQLSVSSRTGQGIHELKERLAAMAPAQEERRIVGDLLSPGDMVVLVTPIDQSAPKGRMILPQTQTLRDVLDADAMALFTKEHQLAQTLSALAAPPKMVITDSQAFGMVSKIVPESVPLTSFSILMARYKGFLETAVRGAAAISSLKEGDTVLISEGCTHHRQCGDIGTVKLPAWIRAYTGKKPVFETSSGLSFPDDLEKYAVIIHCGSCMLNEKEVIARNEKAAQRGIPITNYGMVIAQVHGILERALQPIPEAKEL